MKKRIVSFVLIITMLVAFVPFSDLNFTVNAASSDRDSYKSTYGVSYEELFRKYPAFLNHNTANDYYQLMYDTYADVLNSYGNKETFWASYWYALNEGVFFSYKEFMATVGIGDTVYDECLDKVTLDYLDNVMGVESSLLNEVVKNVSKDYSNLKLTYDLLQESEKAALVQMLKSQNIGITNAEIDKIMKTAFKDANGIMSDVKDGLELCQEVVALFQVYQVDKEMVNKLIELQSDKSSDLYRGLVRLQSRINGDPDYLIDHLITAPVIKKIKKLIQDGMTGTPEAKLATLIVKAVVKIADPVMADELIQALMVQTIIINTGSSLGVQRANFQMNYATDADIEKYETTFNSYIAAYRLAMKKALKLLKKDTTGKSGGVEVCLNSLNSTSYEGYIKACLARLATAIKNGEIDPPDARPIIGKDPPVVKDNTQTIRDRFNAIQAQYPPNVNATYTDSWGGAIQCFGFARMVFSKLFGCEMPYAYMNAYRYKYIDNSNVVLIGQLEEGNVTVDNLKQLLSQAKLGDIIQASGVSQHTMMVVSVNDTGVEVYDANWKTSSDQPDCVINQHWISYSYLSQRYNQHNDYSAAGFSLYRAANYGDITGDGTYVFYDDSVNFQIENGVLVKYKGWQRDIVIPDTVTSIGASAFSDNNCIRSVYIPDTVKSIGESAFENCVNLYRVQMECKITVINNKTFSGCSSLQFINVPNTVTSIGESAFYNCNSLPILELPNSIKRIEDYAFSYCSSLDDVVLSRNLQTLGFHAFEFSGITHIEIPKALESITVNDFVTEYWSSTHSPFADCSELEQVTFEEGTTKVIAHLFSGCPGIEYISIPDSVLKIGERAFCSCENLKCVVIPDTVTSIEDYAFSGCHSLSDVNLPDSLVTLGYYAFAECAMEQIYIPKALESITVNDFVTEYWATSFAPFLDCSNLKKVTFENGITKIIGNLFSGCTGIESISIPNTVSSIEERAFRDCANLNSVTIPDSVKTIDECAFMGCTSLKKINIPSSVTTLNNSVFYGCTALEEVSLSSSLKVIESDMFLGCTSLKSIEIPQYVSKINGAAFSGCTSLESVKMYDNIETIEWEAFYQCNSLTDVALSKSLKTLGGRAFYECNEIKEVVFFDGMNTIESEAFYNCKKLKSVKMTDSVTAIESSAFAKCEVLSDIEISKNVKILSDSVFSGCSSLTNVVIPDGVEVINENAFSEDYKLTDVTIPKSVKEIASNAFSYPKKMTIHGYAGSYAEEYANSKGITFVAIQPFVVTYDANGGTGAPESQSVMPDENLVITGTVPTRHGYSFMGWALTQDAIEAAYQPNGVFKANANTTLYAVWEKVTLSSIAIKALPAITVYTVDDDLDTTGLVLTAEYSDGSQKEVTEGFTVDVTKLTVAGKQKITVTYQGKTAEFEVQVNKAIEAIAVADLPEKTVYNIGESLITDGLTLTVKYKDGSTDKVANGYVCAPVELNAVGTQKITVTYQGKTTTFDVTVENIVLTGIRVDTLPDKTVYNVGDTLNTAGLILTAAYSDDSQEDITSGFTCTPTKLETAGTQKITVTYQGKTTTFDVTVNSTLKITTQPVNQTIKLGNSLTLSLKAEGSGLTYQWYYKKSGQTSFSTWNGRTKASETCTPNATWDGIQLYCIVKDSTGKTVQSNTVKITVTQDLKITTQPVNQTIKLGNALTLSLKAEGSGLTYQWYYKKSGQSTFSKWNGRTKASETCTPNATWNGIQLYCVVKDSTGKSVQSNTVKITVTQDLKITTQPVNQTIKLGNSLTLSLKAEGSGLTYQWYYKKSGQTSFSKWNGRTKASETCTPNATWNGIQLYCIVKDSTGKSVQSNTVKITVTQDLKITTQPVNQTIKLGNALTLLLKAEGSGLTYQWYFKKSGQSSFTKWTNRTHASETVTPNESWNGIQLYCVVKDSAGKSVQSNTIKVTFSDAVTIVTQPANVTVKTGADVKFTVKAEGVGLTYQWYYKKATASDWSKWSGRTAASTTATSNTSWDGMLVRCIVKNSSGKSVTSNAAKITLSDVLAITQQPTNVTTQAGKNVTFTVKAKGAGLTYQWYYKKAGTSDWSKWGARTTASTTATANATWNGMQVRCVVKDSTGKTVTSSAATITIK